MLDLFAAAPVAGFKAAGQSEGEAGGSATPARAEFHVIADGKGLEDAGERGLEEDVEKGEHAEEIELGGILGEGGRDALAEAGRG